MTYPDSVRFLYALGNEIKTAKLGLERIQRVLAALGNPERAFRVVHVAGTNGKGSTCAMIEAALRAAGVRTGLYTSPHLLEPTERIRIDGRDVTTAQFQRAFEAVHAVAEQLDLDCHPTYFETVTAMGFWLFREMGVETAVVEVGLGGRLDATNLVQPALTVITPIDFDHESFLGGTIEQIAAEKAGILKPGVPAVFAAQRPEAARVLEAHAAELHVSVKRAEEYEARDIQITARGSQFNGITCPLAGEHQLANAITAVLACQVLGVRPEGIAEARWPGRLEVVAPNPDILLDGAHNPAGARALARYLERFYPNQGTHRRRWMIFGAMRDKAIEEIGDILFPLADELIFTAAGYSRSLRPEALREIAGRGTVAARVGEALDIMRVGVTPDDLVIITGSLFLVGEAREHFQHTRQRYA
ncbi:MAG TPA: folylpolyglutamate synthase/dihydrofolate synthase family protein [Bryobacteraceae bacterium]|nr:folylpolyglutamate synthase/dihydrofolate synthase family protein [Bryobacteraceae bacterium]